MLLVLFLAACGIQPPAPPSPPSLLSPWSYADLRLLDPADADLPSHDLVAVYLRRSGDDLQLRLDLLADVDRLDYDLYLALQAGPSGTHLLPIQALAGLAWDTLLVIPAAGPLQVLTSAGASRPAAALSVFRDPVNDTLLISLPLSTLLPGYAFSPAASPLQLQVFLTPAGSTFLADETSILRSNDSASLPCQPAVGLLGRLPCLHPRHCLAPLGWRPHRPARRSPRSVQPAAHRPGCRGPTGAARSERPRLPLRPGLRRWAGAGPADGPIRLADPARAAARPAFWPLRPALPHPGYPSGKLQSRLALRLARQPVSLPASVRPCAPNRSQPPVRPPASPGEPGFRLTPSPCCAGRVAPSSLSPPSLPPLAPSLPLAQLDPDGITLDWRRRLLATAIYANQPGNSPENTFLWLGGDLPASAWGDPQSARAAFRWLVAHPWVHFLDRNALLGARPTQPAPFSSSAADPGATHFPSAWHLSGEAFPPASPALTELLPPPPTLLASLQAAPANPLTQAAWQALSLALRPGLPGSAPALRLAPGLYRSALVALAGR